MKISKQELLDGLSALNPALDTDWTEDGLPALDRVQSATFDDSITREDLALNALDFTREVATAASAAREDITEAERHELRDAMTLEQLAASEANRDPEDRRQELAAIVLSAKQALEDHDRAIAKAKLDRDGLMAAVDKATNDLEHEFPPMKHADAVQQWLASEARRREERSRQQYIINAPMSPIDESMSRRTGYGGGRKSIPLMG